MKCTIDFNEPGLVYVYALVLWSNFVNVLVGGGAFPQMHVHDVLRTGINVPMLLDEKAGVRSDRFRKDSLFREPVMIRSRHSVPREC